MSRAKTRPALFSACAAAGLAVGLVGSAHGKIRSQLKPEDLDHSIAVGVSVLHLFVSTLEASAELMMGEKWSLVAIGGIGLIEIPKHDVHPEADATRLTVGGQARKYLTGNSQMGGYVAPEVLVFVDGSDQDDAEGIFAELGLVFGYKETWEDGFMVDLAVGLAGSTGPERKKGDTPLQLVGNLNLGYAF